MIITWHAREAMDHYGISEEEVGLCLELGSLEVKQVVNQEMRYGNKLVTKEKTLMVIYTYRENKVRVITCYLIRRKKWTK